MVVKTFLIACSENFYYSPPLQHNLNQEKIQTMTVVTMCTMQAWFSDHLSLLKNLYLPMCPD